MKLHPFIKLFIFLVVITVISCATLPRTTKLTELRHGDAEDDVINDLGRGSYVLYFMHEENDYHYRVYRMKITDKTYAVLFVNGELIAVTNTGGAFSECLVLDADVNWDSCFTEAMKRMETENLVMESHDFSDEIKTQKRAEYAGTGVAVVMVPLMVVLWPLTVACAGMGAPEIKDSLDCGKAAEEIYDKTLTLYPSSSYSQIITPLDNLQTKYVDGELDNSLELRRLVKRHWGCHDKRIAVSYGFSSERLIWAKFESKKHDGTLDDYPTW